MRYVTAVAALLFAACASAGEVSANDAWVRAPAPGQDNAAAYLHVTVRENARLVAVTSTIAGHVEIHAMKHENGMMMMREVGSLALPAKQAVALSPGGAHLMLIGLKRPIRAGDSVLLKLTVEFSEKRRKIVEIRAEVRPFSASDDMQEMDGMSHHEH